MTRKRKQSTRRRRNRARDQRSLTTSAPAAASSIERSMLNPLDHIRLKHREYVFQLVQQVPNVVERNHLNINVGLETVFPWLSGIARHFEKYKFHHLSFHYVSRVPTSYAGTVMIAPDYDASDDNSSLSVPELMSFSEAVRTVIWQPACCTMKPNRMAKDTLYVRDSGDTEGDIKTFDAGQIEILHDMGFAGPLGEVWVEYDVSLFTPQLQSPDVPAYSADFVPVVGSQPFPPGAETRHLDTADVEPAEHAAAYDELLFRSPGDYLVDLTANGTGFTGVSTPTCASTAHGDSIRDIGSTTFSTTIAKLSFIIRIAKRAAGLISSHPGILKWLGFSAVTIAGVSVGVTKCAPNFTL